MKMVLMSIRAWWLGLLAGMLVLLAITGCATPGAASTVSTRTGGGLSIVTAFYPLQFVAQRIAGDHATVANLTQPGAEPHDVELTPRQVASLTTADLVIYEKGFQPAVNEAVVQSENSHVIDAATIVPLQPLAISEDDLGHAASRNDHQALDPHIWLDPTALGRIARAVARLERSSTTVRPVSG